VSLIAAMHFCCVKVIYRFSNIMKYCRVHSMFPLLDECINLKDTDLNISCISGQSEFFWLSMDLFDGNVWVHRDRGVLGHSSLHCREQLIFFLRITKAE